MAAAPFAAAQAGPPAPEGLTNLPEFTVTQRCRQQKSRSQDDIVVCGRRRERSQYRLPLETQGFDPEAGVDSVSRERHRLYEVGETGIHSCSTVGPGGPSGCSFKAWKEGREQRAGSNKKGLVARVRNIGNEDEEID